MSTLPAANPTMPATVATATSTADRPVAGADFLAMLAQMAGVQVQATAALGTRPSGWPIQAEQEAATPEARLDASLALAMPMFATVMPQMPFAQMPAATEGDQLAPTISTEDFVSSVMSELRGTNETREALPELSTEESATDFESVLAPLRAPELTPSAKAPHAPDAVLSRPVLTPVGSAGWSDEIGSRVTLMAEHGRQSASIRLSPEHLGPLEIRISIRDDQASVWFGAAHADTRAAIEHALPRLREMFESQGMSLADAGVYREAPREHPPSTSARASDSSGPQAEPDGVNVVTVRHTHLLDEYA